MPAFGDLFAEEPDNIWYLVHYVRHVIEGGDPLAGIPELPPEETETTTEDEEADENDESESDEGS